MKAEKIEDAHYFRNKTRSLAVNNEAHDEYVAFINDNYVLRTDEITNVDHINNKPSKHRQ